MVYDEEAAAAATAGPVDGKKEVELERMNLIARKKKIEGGDLNMSAYVIRSNGVLEELPIKEAISSVANKSMKSDPLWLDVEFEGDIEEELPLLTKTVLDLLDLTPFLRRHLAQPIQLQTPQVLPLSKSALVVMRILGANARNTRYAAALCLESILLTVTSSSEQNERIKKLKEDGQKQRSGIYASLSMKEDTLKGMCERELPEASVSGAVALWFNFHLGRTALTTIRLRKTVYDLIDKSENIEEIKLKEINDCKDLLLRSASVTEEQLECVYCLEGGDAMSEGLDFTSPVLKGALSVILSTAKSTERSIGRLEKRVEGLQAKYDSHQQDKINHRLNVLTIINAIFLPLTLITGFWGMNWEYGMPAIRTEHGFYYALAGMICLALSLLFFFYRAGWMDR